MDYIDINSIPDIVTIRGIIAGGCDYESLHKYFAERNPLTAIANKIAIAKSAVIYNGNVTDGKTDLDNPDRPISIVMKGIVDYNNIIGVYSDPTLCK